MAGAGGYAASSEGECVQAMRVECVQTVSGRGSVCGVGLCSLFSFSFYFILFLFVSISLCFYFCFCFFLLFVFELHIMAAKLIFKFLII